jgi:hypothetical protein
MANGHLKGEYQAKRIEDREVPRLAGLTLIGRGHGVRPYSLRCEQSCDSSLRA